MNEDVIDIKSENTTKCPDCSSTLSPHLNSFDSTNSVINQDPENQPDQHNSPCLTLKEAFILTNSITHLNTNNIARPEIVTTPENDMCAVEDFKPPQSNPCAEDDLAIEETCEQNGQSDAITNKDVEEPMTITRFYDWTHGAPNLLSYSEKEFQRYFPLNASQNYLRGCLWSPDGSCILTNSRDNVMRLFNLPSSIYDAEPDYSKTEPEDMTSVLCMRDNELINDCCWYPGMNSSDPVTCCFASTSRRNPIRLWDAFTGLIRATYRPMNHMGELVSAYSIAFSVDGQRLYAGFNRYVQVFETCRPGCDSVRRPKLGRKPYQGGIISCIGVLKDPSRSIYATGSYNGTVCIYSEPGNLITRLQAHPPGVTQIMFSGPLALGHGAPWYLLAGGRMDSRIFVWDARNWETPVCTLHRRIENHQRFQFDLDPFSRYLFTGSQTGVVCVYDLVDSVLHSNDDCKPALTWRAHSDCSHGLSVHPNLPMVATTSGQRRIEFPKSVCKPCTKPTKVETDLPTDTNTIPDSEHLSPKNLSDEDDDMSVIDEAEITLADEQASLMSPRIDGSDPNPAILPLQGELTRLPRENKLNLWYFTQTLAD